MREEGEIAKSCPANRSLINKTHKFQPLNQNLKKHTRRLNCAPMNLHECLTNFCTAFEIFSQVPPIAKARVVGMFSCDPP